MNEYAIGWTFTGALVGLVIACTLYWLGGRAGKWKRRFCGSAVLAGTNACTSAILGCFSPWFLLAFPLLAVGFSLPYGDNTLFLKVVRRTIYALAVVGAGVVFCVVLGGKAWVILPLHVGVALWSVWLGVKNPIHAPAEEGIVCLLLNTGFIAYPFVS